MADKHTAVDPVVQTSVQADVSARPHWQRPEIEDFETAMEVTAYVARR
ncbi:pyrroloquinoline quinone precursor peptide PqqA [Goodfellowiella coeruleoviolacea]|uniref:Coenzyme PQQ synthesis protein A n=1 Tax=Goodfellowiella coeruleoviolacea TaxID=334858 RepID=A0AAE3KJA0_9PSEU|nr:pyrroloquinoline quinone precursor peptide PqqA [Goodfellowiella coeruleoviolacea]MCP2164093.1 coenzyme PQQ precursor peptide PqqA [Goodfellowiella coeruleoviolacea]